MIDFGAEIKRLINENDFLILPKIGAFVANYTQPKIDPVTNLIIEPTKYFSFNPFFIEDDNNKFFNKISNNHVFTLKEIEIEYESFIKKFKENIVSKNQLEIEDIGYFFKNPNNLLDFKFEKKEILDEPKIVYETPEVIEIKREETFEPITSYPIVSINSTEKKSDKILKGILYAAPIILLCWGLYNLFFSSSENLVSKKVDYNNNETKDSLVLESKIDSIQTEKNVTKTEEIKPPKEETKKIIPKKEPKAVEKNDDDYRIVVGLYRNYENAENLKENLISKGIKANADYKGDLKRIFVRANSESEAIKLKAEIENITGEKAVYSKNK